MHVHHNQPYPFTDAREMHLLNPLTFPVPTPKALAGLRAGQRVKIGVEAAPKQEERLWVRITKPASDAAGGSVEHEGVLVSQPTMCTRLKRGVPVRFEPRHVLDIGSD